MSGQYPIPGLARQRAMIQKGELPEDYAEIQWWHAWRADQEGRGHLEAMVEAFRGALVRVYPADTPIEPNIITPGEQAVDPNWQRAGPVDISVVRFWRAQCANLALRTGRFSNVGVLVVDPDLGARTPAWVPATVTVEIGLAMHYYFQLAPGQSFGSRIRLRPGVDYRGENGLVLLPDSVDRNDQVYRWKDGHAPGEIAMAPVPSELVALLQKPEAPAPSAAPVSPASTAQLPTTTSYGTTPSRIIRLIRSLRATGWRPRPAPDNPDVPPHLRGRPLEPDEVPHALPHVAAAISEIYLIKPWVRDAWTAGQIAKTFLDSTDGDIYRLAAAAGVETKKLKDAMAIFTAYPTTREDVGVFRLRISTALALLSVPEPIRTTFADAAYDEGWSSSRTQWEICNWERDQRELHRILSM